MILFPQNYLTKIHQLPANGIKTKRIGDYYGVDLGRVIPVTDITILQGASETDHDYFHNFVLEYSETGEDGSWVTIQEYKGNR